MQALDLFQLEKRLAEVLIGPPTDPLPVVRLHGGKPGPICLQAGQLVVVRQMDRGDRHLVWVEPARDVARVAGEGGLQIHLADGQEMVEEEGHKVSSSVPGPDVAYVEFGVAPFHQVDLLVGKFDPTRCGGFLQPEQPLLPGR